MARTMDRQRNGLGRIVLEIERLLGEIKSLERRDRRDLTREDCRRVEAQLERKRMRLREMQSRAFQVGPRPA